MAKASLPNLWKAEQKGSSWVVTDGKKTIATIAQTGNDRAIAKLVAASPYMLDSLKALMQLIGEEDLPDNGELSGAAICDMANTAISLATK